MFAFLVALFVGLVISFLFAAMYFGWRPRAREEPDPKAAIGTAAYFFVIVFLATWAGGLWLYPFGPVLGRVHVLPFALVGVIVALIVAAKLPDEPWRRGSAATGGVMPAQAQVSAVREEGARAAALGGLGVFFWLLVAVLAFAILMGYVA